MGIDERSFNAYMSRIRIPIEQVFGNSDQKFGFISNRQNLKVNLQSVGKNFKMAMFIFNCLSLSQGNQSMTQSGFNRTLRLSVRASTGRCACLFVLPNQNSWDSFK